MRHGKYMIIFLAVLILGVSGIVYFVSNKEEEGETLNGVLQEEIFFQEEEPEQSKEKSEESLTEKEKFTLYLDEKTGEASLDYINFANNFGDSSLVIPSKFKDKEIKIVDLVWLEAGEETPVTYLKSVEFQEGIEKLSDSLCYVTNLQTAKIPASMKSMPDNTFEESKDSVTLFVVKESYGEEFAKKNGFQYEYQKEK